ncbi:MAG: hypothetical protein LUH06_05950 [Oscillospiraceae bacterium]|nr:hypothetical protein [Oscillospiraceae bacterium]
MDIPSYYASQSAFTDPGAQSGLCADLPETVPELVKVIQGVCLLFEERYKYPIQNERFLETNLRYVEDILKQIVSLNKTMPLTQTHPEDQRFMASSSHFAMLLCAMLRLKGIPARKRTGFISFDGYRRRHSFDGYYRIHDIVEYLDGGEWKQVDPTGVAKDFVPAGTAWLDAHDGMADEAKFRDEEHRGLEVARAALMLDLAGMMKIELLHWDRYGWMLVPLTDFHDYEWGVLNRLGALLKGGDEMHDALTALYQSETGLQVPEKIRSDSPLVPPYTVELKEAHGLWQM